MNIPLSVPATLRADIATTADSASDTAASPAVADRITASPAMAERTTVSLFADALRAIGGVLAADDVQAGPAVPEGSLPDDDAASDATDLASVAASESGPVAVGAMPIDSLSPDGSALSTLLSAPWIAPEARAAQPAGATGAVLSAAAVVELSAAAPDATIPSVAEGAAASARAAMATAPAAAEQRAAPPARVPDAVAPVLDAAATTSREPARTASAAVASGVVPAANDPRRTFGEIASPAAPDTASHAGVVASAASGDRAVAHERVLRLASGGTESPHGRAALQEALGDRLRWQLERGSERAFIRLDPPSLGRIEIAIRHEGGSLQVHLSASNGEVLRQLAQIGDGLRQDLAHRQYGDVQVLVGEGAFRDADGRSRQPQRQERDEMPNQALAEVDEGRDATAFVLAPEGWDRT